MLQPRIWFDKHVSKRSVDIDPDFARSLSDIERRLVRLYYCEDVSPEKIEAELEMPYEDAMELLRTIGEVEYQIEWQPRHGEGPVTLLRRKRSPHQPAS